MTASATKPRKRGGCPVCGDATEVTWRPFCSKRCADIDLGRWLQEDYRIPVVEEDESPPDEEMPGAERVDR